MIDRWSCLVALYRGALDGRPQGASKREGRACLLAEQIQTPEVLTHAVPQQRRPVVWSNALFWLSKVQLRPFDAEEKLRCSIRELDGVVVRFPWRQRPRNSCHKRSAAQYVYSAVGPILDKIVLKRTIVFGKGVMCLHDSRRTHAMDQHFQPAPARMGWACTASKFHESVSQKKQGCNNLCGNKCRLTDPARGKDLLQNQQGTTGGPGRRACHRQRARMDQPTVACPSCWAVAGSTTAQGVPWPRSRAHH